MAAPAVTAEETALQELLDESCRLVVYATEILSIETKLWELAVDRLFANGRKPTLGEVVDVVSRADGLGLQSAQVGAEETAITI